jgi:2,3-diketo-5-methylthio-1-phosphopentane phosphatase
MDKIWMKTKWHKLCYLAMQNVWPRHSSPAEWQPLAVVIKDDYRMLQSRTNETCGISRKWEILCDFDGTITPVDVTDAILGEFAHPSWEEAERAWLAGTITARECMSRQVGLIDAPIAALDAFLDSVPITDGFKEFAHFCTAGGVNPAIVSDGLDYAIRRILFRHGLDNMPVIANRLCCRSESGYRLEFPYGIEGCASGVCKCDAAKALGGKFLLIGDGRSDCCVSSLASLVLAKQGKELERHCIAEQYTHRSFADFFDVVAILEKAA